LLVAMTVVGDILKRNEDSFLNDAISMIGYIHSCFPNSPCGKQYIEILVDLKVKVNA